MAKAKKAKQPKIGRPTGRKPLLNLRVDHSLHKRLGQAAAAAGRTTSEEAVRLLDSGLRSDSLLEQAIKLAFGGEITGYLMDIGFIMKTKAQGNPDWCETPATFDEVASAIAAYFDARNPRGEMVPMSTEKPNTGMPD